MAGLFAVAAVLPASGSAGRSDWGHYRLAFTTAHEREGGPAEIHTLDDQGRERRFTREWPQPQPDVAWARRDHRLIFDTPLNGFWSAEDTGAAPRRLPLKRASALAVADDGSRIAYEGEDGRIWTASPDATRRRPLGAAFASVDDLAWAPDAKTLAASACTQVDCGIYVVGQDGHRRRLTPRQPQPEFDDELTPEELAWSPDGTRIAYFYGQYDSDIADVRVVDVATRRVRRIGRGDYPAWSPDARRLAYVGIDGLFDTDGLYVARATGGSPRLRADVGGHESKPAWTSDGRRLVFDLGRRRSFTVWTVPADGGRATRAVGVPPLRPTRYWRRDGTVFRWQHNAYRTDSAEGPVTLVVSTARGVRHRFVFTADRAAMWSPDGRSVAIERYRLGAEQLILADGDGSRGRSLGALRGPGTDDPRGEGLISWSPRGDGLLFTSPRGLMLWRPGLAARRLSVGSDIRQEASWSPDGSKIAYGSGDAITVLDLVSGRRRRLRPRPATPQIDPRSVRWSPAADRIAFLWSRRRCRAHDELPEYLAVLSLSSRRLQEPPMGSPSRGPCDAARPLLEWSPDGRQLAFVPDLAPRAVSPGAFEGIALFDPAAGTVSYRSLGEPVWALAWSPDGRWIADGTSVVDPTGRQPTQRPGFHGDAVTWQPLP